jgi:hypothetical protein
MTKKSLNSLSIRLLSCALLFSGLSSNLSAANTEINKDHDWQFWNRYSLNSKLTEKMTAQLSTEARFGADFTRHYYQHAQLSFNYRLTDNFMISPGIRESYSLLTSSAIRDDWGHNHELLLAMNCNWKMGDWNFSDRNLFHFVHASANQNIKNYTLYRNCIKAQLPCCKLTSLQLVPFISDELFFKESVGYFRNRAQIGVTAQLLEKVSMNLFYQWQTTETSTGWRTLNAFGLFFNGSF